jgi:hypothetical protein
MKCKKSLEEFDTRDWELWPNLEEVGGEWHSSCPSMPVGSRDGENYNRLVISNNLIWCRHCQAGGVIKGEESPRNSYIPPEQRIRTLVPLPKEHIVSWEHACLEERDYFHDRGISDKTIDRYRLGYNPISHRYSIPHHYKGQLYGIQYRMTKAFEEYLILRGVPADEVKASRFTSEKGSQCNDVLFNDIGIKGKPYVLIVESRLDALTLTELGFPACVANQDYPELKAIPEKIIIPDNDGGKGDEIGLRRAHRITGTRWHRIPEGFKDSGELLRSMNFDQRKVYGWLGLRPIPGD